MDAYVVVFGVGEAIYKQSKGDQQEGDDGGWLKRGVPAIK